MLQYAITDRRFFHDDERKQEEGLLQQLAALSQQQVDLLQIREKDLAPPDLLTLARRLRLACPRGQEPQLLLNGPAELALAADLDGVHLPGGWLPTDLDRVRLAFRNAARPPAILSVTAHTLAEVRAAHAAHADLILFGPVFEKSVRGKLLQPGTGLAALTAAVAAAAPTPVLALGGITPANLRSCLAAGAAGVAAIRLYLPSSETAPPDRPAR